MNDFESERAAKAARFRQLAEKHANIATGRHFAARERLEMIPLGQPILVGHHSEKRHRKDLKRIDQHFAEAKEHHDKAEYFRRRAAAAESNVVIFSDDPDATEKLVDKIERLKKRQGVMKRANQLIRKADREGLADLGFSEETITKLFSQDYAGRVGFPNYALTNNSANIRRLEKRLAAIQNTQNDETTEERFTNGVCLVDNVEANRLQIFFPEIPSERDPPRTQAQRVSLVPDCRSLATAPEQPRNVPRQTNPHQPHVMTPPILDEPIRGAVQQRRKSRAHALHGWTWFRIVGTLASGKKLTLRRRSNNSYSHVALCACPGVDNQPEAYFWTNGKVPKTFHMEDTKWWLLGLIPIELK